LANLLATIWQIYGKNLANLCYRFIFAIELANSLIRIWPNFDKDGQIFDEDLANPWQRFGTDFACD
jgi:hypothetical protein